MAVTFEMDLNHYSIRRDIYNLLDLIGDIGALVYGLFMIFSVLMAFFNFQRLENYLVSHQFQVLDQETLSKRNQVAFKKGHKVVADFHTGLYPNKLNYFREVIYGKFLPLDYVCPCKFMQRTRMERLFEKGRKHFRSEMDIVNLIKDIRAMKSTLRLKFALTKQEKQVIGLE